MAPQVHEELVVVESGQEVGIRVYDGTEEGDNDEIPSNPPSPAKSPSPEKPQSTRSAARRDARSPTESHPSTQEDRDLLDKVFEGVEGSVCGGEEDAGNNNNSSSRQRHDGLNLVSCNSIIEDEVVFEDTPRGTPRSTTLPTTPSIVMNPTPEFRVFSEDNKIHSSSKPPRTPTLAEPERPKPEISDAVLAFEAADSSTTIFPITPNKKSPNGTETVESNTISAPRRRSPKHETSGDDPAATTPQKEEKQLQTTANQDLIDSIMGSLGLHSYFCRQQTPPKSPPQQSSHSKSGRDIPHGSDDNNNNSHIEAVGSDDSSPIKLHALATPGGGSAVQDKDSLDRVFEGVERFVCREKPTSVNPTEESSENDRSSSSRLSMFRENSLLDLVASNSDPEEPSSSSRLDEIRRKKRDIEAQVKSTCSEPGVLVPRGYLHNKDIPTENTMSMSMEETRKSRQKVVAIVAVCFVVVAITLVIISFVWPTDKL